MLMRTAELGLRWTVIRSTAIAALGGLLFGFDTAVIAGATRQLTAMFHLTPARLGVTVSCAISGTIISCLLAPFPGERFGTRTCLRITAILYLASALGCALAETWSILLLARFVGGVGIGACSIFSPMYIAESAPAKWRGRLVACFQLSIVSGILIAYFSNSIMESLYRGPDLWRLELGAAALPAVGFLAALFFIPQSSRWLVKMERFEEAETVLHENGFEEPRIEVNLIRSALLVSDHASAPSIFKREFRRPLLIALALGLFNQFSGINAILYYLNDIFRQAGFQGVSAGHQATGIGVANLLFTLLGMSLIDRIGRKPLLVVGGTGMACSLIGIALIFSTGRSAWMLLPLLLTFIAFFAASQGAVVWVYFSEIFPSVIRERGQSFASFWLWLLTGIVSGFFPSLAAVSHSFPFFFFALTMAIQVLVVARFFPETKGKTLG